MILKRSSKLDSINRRILFFKIASYFTFLVILSGVSIFLIFSSIYTKEINDKLQKEGENNLQKYSNNIDNLFYAYLQSFVAYQNIPELITYFYSKKPDYAAIIRINQLLPPLKASLPYLHSILLLNSDYTTQSYCGKLGIDESQFISGDISRPEIHSSFNVVFCSINPNNLYGKKSTRSISLIFNQEYKKANSCDKSAIFTIDREELESKLLSNLYGHTYIIDENEEIIFSNDSKPIPLIFEKDEFFKKIISSRKTKGNFQINNKNIIFIKSTVTGLYIVNEQPYRVIGDIINKQLTTIIAFCIVVLIIYCLIGILISKKIYSPIGKIVNMLRTQKIGQNTDSIDETTIILKAFTEAERQLLEFNNLNEDHSTLLKLTLLKEILNGKYSKDIIETKISKLSLTLDYTNLILVSLSIDNYINMSQDKKYLYESTLLNTIPEILKDEFNCEIIAMDEGYLAILLNFVSVQENNFNTLLNSMELIRSSSLKTLGVSVTIGIGGIATNICECTSAYKKAKNMVSQRFVLGNNLVIHEKLLDDTLIGNVDYPIELEEKLIQSIRKNNIKDFQDYLQLILKMIKKHNYHDASSIVFQTISVCIKTFNDVISQDKRNSCVSFERILFIFSNIQTVDDLVTLLISQFEEYSKSLDEINALKNNKHYHIVNKTLEYIKEIYTDPNLTTESISASTGYTPYYFTKIFKEITGIHITDYINQLRIQKAKELLKTSNIKTSDISNMIGFTNISNFYLVFKKNVGLSPVAYKECVLKIANE